MNHTDFEHKLTMLRRTAKTMNRRQLESLILSYAEKEGIQAFREKAVEEILRRTTPGAIVPPVYDDFRLIVEDGIRFLLSHISVARLIQLSTDQLLLPETAGVEERLILLAKKIPTLHKLGQVIARNQNIDDAFRDWLIQLEHGFQGAEAEGVRAGIKEELGDDMNAYIIKMEDRLHFEASVGATVLFDWVDKTTGKASKGIFKVLKPGVKEHIREELDILERLAKFFDQNRRRYPLKQFRFIDAVSDVREALIEEINLSGEQDHLKKASVFYSNRSKTRIPGVLPFSGQNVTAMEFMAGGKITDMHLSASRRSDLAHSLFNAVFWMPLFSTEEHTIFHGDPHAGNIYSVEDKNGGAPGIALLDWSLAGRLSRNQRIWIIKMIIGVTVSDEELIAESVYHLSDDRSAVSCEKIIKSVSASNLSDRNRHASFIKQTFSFIDQTAFNGIQYAKDILLLRKSVFTLEGVLHDIDPSFNMDLSIFRLLENLFFEELPYRWLQLLFPFTDSAHTYKTLMSNRDLYSLANGILSKKIRKSVEIVSRMTSGLWTQPTVREVLICPDFPCRV